MLRMLLPSDYSNTTDDKKSKYLLKEFINHMMVDCLDNKKYLSLLSPNPRLFPDIKGRVVKKDEQFYVSLKNLKSYRMDFICRDNQSKYKLCINEKDFTLENRNGALFVNEQHVFKDGRHIKIFITSTDKGLNLEINKQAIDIIDIKNTLEIKVSQENAALYILQTVQIDIFNNIKLDEFITGDFLETASPYYTLEWEKSTRAIFNNCISLIQIGEYLSEKNSKSPILKKINEFFLDVLNIYKNWTYWRPSAQDKPYTGLWDRNNWSNGFIAGSYGLAYRYLSNYTSLKLDEDIYYQIIEKKSSQWLLPKSEYLENNDNTPDKAQDIFFFPSVKHWEKRSTNHVIIIYLSHLIGLYCFNKNNAETIENDLQYLINSAFDKGVYIEGVSYANFIIIYSIIHSIIKENLKKESPISSDLYRDVKEWFLKSCDIKGHKYGLFGDGNKIVYENFVIYYLSNLYKFDEAQEMWLLEGLKKINNYSVSNFSKSFIPLTLYYHNKSIAEEKSREEWCIIDPVTYYKKHSMFSYSDTNNASLLNIWFFGSTLHKTHNRSYDFLNYYIQLNGKNLTDRAGIYADKVRKLYQYNSIGLKDVAIIDNDPYNCCGKISKDNEFLFRGFNVEIQTVVEKETFVFAYGGVLSAKNRSIISDAYNKKYIKEYSRCLYIDKKHRYIVIIDFIKKTKEEILFWNYHIPEENVFLLEDNKIFLNNQQQINTMLFDLEKKKESFAEPFLHSNSDGINRFIFESGFKQSENLAVTLIRLNNKPAPNIDYDYRRRSLKIQDSGKVAMIKVNKQGKKRFGIA